MATFVKPFTETKERSEKFAQNFDKEKITITMKGKIFNLYDYIQAGREDTEIYPTLEKYGNLQVLERPAEEIIADFSENMDLRDLAEQDNRLRILFENLPLKEKQVFKNDFYKFKAEGLNYYTEKAKKEIAQQQQTQQQNVPPTNNDGGTNEQK